MKSSLRRHALITPAGDDECTRKQARGCTCRSTLLQHSVAQGQQREVHEGGWLARRGADARNRSAGKRRSLGVGRSQDWAKASTLPTGNSFMRSSRQQAGQAGSSAYAAAASGGAPVDTASWPE